MLFLEVDMAEVYFMSKFEDWFVPDSNDVEEDLFSGTGTAGSASSLSSISRSSSYWFLVLLINHNFTQRGSWNHLSFPRHCIVQ